MADFRWLAGLTPLVAGNSAMAHPWHGRAPEGEAADLIVIGPVAWLAAAAVLFACAGRGKAGAAAALAGLALAILGCGGAPEVEKSPVEPDIARHFKRFAPRVTVDWDGRYLLVSSDGLPDHPMMVGIRAWQQQVPLPQPYSGANAWRIPLQPVKADKPVSARRSLYRGAIALAVNGVPIFNALNNRGEDAFLAGELDEHGGHCGRGDDYHYHIAPAHLEKVVGKGNPIAFALDGYPIYGFADSHGIEPADLDEFNGRDDESGGYRYHATRAYPYINGGLRGKVVVRGDQVEPQPRDNPLRPPGRPLPGAVITAFSGDPAAGECSLTYMLDGAEHQWRYGSNGGAKWTFTRKGPDGNESVNHYQRR
jgi:hypothetical protein